MKALQDGWRHFSEGVAALSFAVMFAAFILQVISRYVFNSPIAWTLELCAISYVWAVFWSCSILVSERQQIVFDVIFNAVAPPARRWLAVFITGSLVITFAAAIPGVIDYIQFLGRRTTMLLKVRMDLVYSCFAIFMLAVVAGGARRLLRLFGRDWEKAL